MGITVINSSGYAKGMAGAAQAYTPAWTSTGTQPAIGNGSIVGSYIQIGSLVYGSILVKYGTTTSSGTGIFSFGLPVTADGTGAFGAVYGSDAGVNNYVGAAVRDTTTTLVLTTMGSPVGFYTGTTPWTMGNGDSFVITFTYEAA
jgi:hypothetical protein